MILVVGSIYMELEHHCEVFPNTQMPRDGSFYKNTGGKGFLQAVAASRMHRGTVFVGAVGRDDFGAELKQILRQRFTEFYISVEETLSGTAGVFIDQSGNRMRVHAQGANRLLRSKRISEDLWGRTNVLLVQFDSNLQTTTELLKRTFRSSICSILHAVPLPKQSVGDSVHLADVVICNEQTFSDMVRQFHLGGYGDFTENQLHALSDAKLNEMCRQCFENTVILTLGARGCFVSTLEQYKLFPSASDLEVVDASGAGDVFAGSFAAAMEYTGYDVLKSARIANIVAGMCCTYIGELDAIPTRDAIDDALKKLGL